MALPTSPDWSLANFDSATIGGLLSLGPGDATITPSTSPYFFYADDYRTFVAESKNGTEATVDLTTPLPSKFTVEVVARFPMLPHNFGDLDKARVGLSVADDAGRGVSIYFSSAGLAISRVDDLNSVSALPDTSDLIRETSSYVTLRVAVDSGLGRAYVYISEGDTTQPVFRLVIPVEETPPTITDLFSLFVLGSASEPARMEIRRLQLTSGLVIPNILPVSDAGPDRVVPVGQAARLDGRASFDIEGAPLSYSWVAIDAPFGSSFVADISGGGTSDDGDSDTFTDTLTFVPGALPSWVQAGDILLIDQTRHVIDSANNAGGTLTTTTDTLSDSYSNQPFRVVGQSVLVGADTETPYVLPDVQGLYRFALTVSDGDVISEESEVLVNTVGARAPFGLEPDVSPIWKGLGDEWRLIEGRGVFEEAWRGVAQILGGKLLEAWQHHYNFSIRDAQGTFQYKWRPYRTLVTETAPDDFTIEPRFGALLAGHSYYNGDPAVAGNTIVVETFTGASVGGTTSTTITFTGDTIDTVVADLNSALSSVGVEAYKFATQELSSDYLHQANDGAVVDDGDGDSTTPTWSFTPLSIPAWVQAGDTLLVDTKRYEITSVDNVGGALEVTPELPITLLTADFRIWRVHRVGLRSSSAAFRISADSTATALGFPTGTFNSLGGSAGVRVTDDSFFVDSGVDLVAAGVSRGDLLVLNNGQAFSVAGTTTGIWDPGPNQRLLLSDKLPFDATAEWGIPSIALSSSVDYEENLSYPGDLIKFEAYDTTSAETTDLLGYVQGVKGNQLAVTIESLYGVLAAPNGAYDITTIGVKRRKALPLQEETLSIPQLQDLIPAAASPSTWKEQVDYILEPFYRNVDESAIPALQFRDSVFIDSDIEPPDVLWAELVLESNEPNVENLFGRLTGFLRDDAAAFGEDFNYVSGVAGLLYAQQRGPRVYTTKVGAQILLGQPFAEVAGVITEIRDDYSPTEGRIVIQDDDGNVPSQSEVFRSYFYRKDPLDLSATSGLDLNTATGSAWAEGDAVEQFAPLGAGVALRDLYNDPKWWIPFVRSGLLTELEKFHHFVVSFNLDLVSLANLGLLVQFMTRVKPEYTHPIILGNKFLEEDLDITDDLAINLTMHLFDLPCSSGPSGMYDDYRGDGSIWTSFDDGLAFYDSHADCPLDTIDFILTMDWPGGTLTYDAIAVADIVIVDIDGNLGAPGSTFTPTYDQVLPAGAYQVTLPIKSTGVVS